jgi:hypothetical protein
MHRSPSASGESAEDWDPDQYVLAPTPETPQALNAFLLEHDVQLNKTSGFAQQGTRTVDDLFVEIAVEGLSTLWIVSEMATSRWGGVQVESSLPIALETTWFQPLPMK